MDWLFPQGVLSQSLFLSMLLGGGFLIANFAMGHIHEGDAGDGGGHGDGHGGHGDAHGHGDANGHGDAHGDHGHGDHGDGDHAEGHDTDRYGPVSVIDRTPNRIILLMLTFMSPMTISVFLCFFGMAGYLAGYFFPFIGLLSLVPAVIGGVVAVNLFKVMIKSLIKYGTSSSHVRAGEIVGHTAQVLIPISETRPGEVTYIINSKLYNAAARSTKGEPIKKGTKVIIVETDGPTVFVEPYKDVLEEEFQKQ